MSRNSAKKNKEPLIVLTKEEELDRFFFTKKTEKLRRIKLNLTAIAPSDDEIVATYFKNNFPNSPFLHDEDAKIPAKSHLNKVALIYPKTNLMTYIELINESLSIGKSFVTDPRHFSIFNKALSQDLSFGVFILEGSNRRASGVPQFFMMQADYLMRNTFFDGELFYKKNQGVFQPNQEPSSRCEVFVDSEVTPLLRLSKIALIMDLMNDDLIEAKSDIETIRSLLEKQEMDIENDPFYKKVIEFINRRELTKKSAMEFGETRKPTNEIIGTLKVTLANPKAGSEEIVGRYKCLTYPMPIKSVKIQTSESLVNREFPWMEMITRAIFKEIRNNQRFSRNGCLFKPILLVGDAGSGKTRYAKRLTEIIDIPSRVITIGGSSDNRSIAGTARSWNESRPSSIVSFIAEEGVVNPVIILDEIEKIGRGRSNGSVHDTLLQLLEPINAANFFDEYLINRIDLSGVSYIATANSINDIPSPLRDRFTVIKVRNPSYDQIIDVAKQIWDRHWLNQGIPLALLPNIDEELLRSVLPKKSASLRSLKKVMDVVIRNSLDSNPLMTLH